MLIIAGAKMDGRVDRLPVPRALLAKTAAMIIKTQVFALLPLLSTSAHIVRGGKYIRVHTQRLYFARDTLSPVVANDLR